MKIGHASTRITPPAGTLMGGYGSRREPARGIHDDLYCRALFLDNGSTRVVLASCDLVGLSRAHVRALKARVHDQLGIPPTHVLVSATHTHSGPRNIDLFGPAYAGHEVIYDRVLDTVAAATRDPFEGTLTVRAGPVRDVSFNRREWDPNSAVVDYETVVLEVLDAAGTPRVVAYNFGCHPVVMGPDNLQISADWPHFAREALETRLPSAPHVIYFQGALGNVNPVNMPFNGPPTPNTFEDAREIGEGVADQVVRILEGPATPLGDALAGATTDVELEADDPEKLEEFTFATIVERAGTPRVVTALQALNVGGVVVAGVPGELFAELGTRIKGLVPDAPATMVVGFANDYIGYIPTRAAFEAGGYEALMMSLSPDEGDAIVDGIAGLVQKVIP